MIYSFQDYDHLYLVMDHLSGGDLRFHLNNGVEFSEKQTSKEKNISIYLNIEFLIACVICALEYVHNNKIIHRDIKPENLVFDQKGYLHITDFGVARDVNESNIKETSGTPEYMSPEVLCGKNHSFPSDYYAIGIITYELMMGHRPYYGRTRKAVREQMTTKEAKITFDNLPYGWSYESADFINRLLRRKEEKRLGYREGISELKKHPWFKDINWDLLLDKKLQPPYIPNKSNNFNKSYCELEDNLNASTIERFKSYANKENYEKTFEGFTCVYDEEEVNRILASTTRTSSVVSGNNSIQTKEEQCSIEDKTNIKDVSKPKRKLLLKSNKDIIERKVMNKKKHLIQNEGHNKKDKSSIIKAGFNFHLMKNIIGSKSQRYNSHNRKNDNLTASKEEVKNQILYEINKNSRKEKSIIKDPFDYQNINLKSGQLINNLNVQLPPLFSPKFRDKNLLKMSKKRSNFFPEKINKRNYF